MNIFKIASASPEYIRLWEDNMCEPWSDYEKATKFVQQSADGKITGAFCVYWDNSDGIQGHYVSGWSARKNIKSVIGVIRHLADMLGEIFIKTDKRAVRILGVGNLVKVKGRFSYYKVKGANNGTT